MNSEHPEFSEMLDKAEELNLKLKTKIIELENELNHEKIRAKQYEMKFKDALLQSQFTEQEDILQKLTTKEKELIDCRKQILELNRRLASANHAPTQTDLIALARENEELMENIEQIKEAAISAIMAKEEEIEELQKTTQKYELMEAELRSQYEKYDNLDREYDAAVREKDDEIRQLSERISRERENFMGKLFSIQKDATQEEFTKQRLYEKAFQLEGTVEKTQQLILEYEEKIGSLQTETCTQKLNFQKEKARLQMEVQGLREDLRMAEKESKYLLRSIEELKGKEREARETLKKTVQANQQLHHKLHIKKKRQNKALKDKITSSFIGITKNNPVYASFAFSPKDSIIEREEEVEPKHLGDYPQLQEIDDFIQNYNVEELDRKPQETKQVSPQQKEPLSKIMMKKNDHKLQQSDTREVKVDHETLQSNILRLQTEKTELQTLLTQAYNEIEAMNKNVQGLTSQLQAERVGMAELRSQLKKTKKEAELIVELQSLTLHIEKLQMDMVASKLKYAEEAEFLREKYNREKVMWTQKLVQLTDKIAKQDLLIQSKGEEKKKKKGFFG